MKGNVYESESAGTYGLVRIKQFHVRYAEFPGNINIVLACLVYTPLPKNWIEQPQERKEARLKASGHISFAESRKQKQEQIQPIFFQ